MLTRLDTSSLQFARYDLTIACRDIGLGRLHVPELLGDIHIDPITAEGAYEVRLDSRRVQNKRLLGLLRRYAGRKAFQGGPTEAKTKLERDRSKLFDP